MSTNGTTALRQFDEDEVVFVLLNAAMTATLPLKIEPIVAIMGLLDFALQTAIAFDGERGAQRAIERMTIRLQQYRAGLSDQSNAMN